jgi:hypothetical protein
MKAYVITTGSAFGLLVLVHIWRIAEEGAHVVTDPWFSLSTVAAAALSIWAWRLLRLLPRS